MKKILSVCLLLFCTACGMYTSNFECAPGKGIGCAPVSEVLDLVVEKEDGEDLFAADQDEARLLREQQKKKKQVRQDDRKKYYLLQERDGKPVIVEATGVSP